MAGELKQSSYMSSVEETKRMSDCRQAAPSSPTTQKGRERDRGAVARKAAAIGDRTTKWTLVGMEMGERGEKDEISACFPLHRRPPFSIQHSKRRPKRSSNGGQNGVQMDAKTELKWRSLAFKHNNIHCNDIFFIFFCFSGLALFHSLM